MSNRFTVRVYGIVLDAQRGVLISHEKYEGIDFSKFPGGGLEYGEGAKEALIREFQEELGVDIQVGQHLYTTDFFLESQFKPGTQVISIYYYVSAERWPEILPKSQVQKFEWVDFGQLHAEMFTFETEKRAFNELSKQLNSLK
jgi:8-oxo-dGTP diphosphatase